MIEKLIYLDNVDLAEFCGVQNARLTLLRSKFPKLHITCRGEWLKVLGDAEEVAALECHYQVLSGVQCHYRLGHWYDMRW